MPHGHADDILSCGTCKQVVAGEAYKNAEMKIIDEHERAIEALSMRIFISHAISRRYRSAMPLHASRAFRRARCWAFRLLRARLFHYITPRRLPVVYGRATLIISPPAMKDYFALPRRCLSAPPATLFFSPPSQAAAATVELPPPTTNRPMAFDIVSSPSFSVFTLDGRTHSLPHEAQYHVPLSNPGGDDSSTYLPRDDRAHGIRLQQRAQDRRPGEPSCFRHAAEDDDGRGWPRFLLFYF